MSNKPNLDQFRRLRDFICEQIGIYYEDHKINLFTKHVLERISVLKFSTPVEYLMHLKFGDTEGRELQNLVNRITTNETYMFREYEQLEAFANHALPEVLEYKMKQKKSDLHIWSAACSSGEEPYTLAIILLEVIENPEAWNIRITANDIDEGMLRKVRLARYGERSVKDVPEEYFQKHLQRIGPEWEVREPTRRLVIPMHMNLKDRSKIREVRNLDFIFCRNALIYFDDDSRSQVVQSFFDSLNPGGYLFLGHSESVGRINTSFRVRHAGGQIMYYKPRE